MKKYLVIGLVALISAGTSGCWWGWGRRDDGHGRHDEGRDWGHEHGRDEGRDHDR